jgi:hypothetical protein
MAKLRLELRADREYASCDDSVVALHVAELIDHISRKCRNIWERACTWIDTEEPLSNGPFPSARDECCGTRGFRRHKCLAWSVGPQQIAAQLTMGSATKNAEVCYGISPCHPALY